MEMPSGAAMSMIALIWMSACDGIGDLDHLKHSFTPAPVAQPSLRGPLT
jgi:hypothetical protein